MKKTGIVISSLAGALILCAAFVIPANHPSTDPPKGITDSVWTIVQKSCYDCHANDGNAMAKSKLNFDNWENYSSDKQTAKAQDMCDEISKGKMPPSKYRKNNPEAVPTEADATVICNWAKTLEK
ncbi:MAG: heme-binding domain-containing protein [Bacteroidales bacterium]|nr:heme-binding domain-containing protein [Bacteroidales bacterium]